MIDWPANLSGPHHKLGLVVGGATGWQEDLADLAQIIDPWPGLVVGVNDVGTHLPHIHELCTLHHEGRTGHKNEPPTPWALLRERNGLPPVPVVATANSDAWPIDVMWRNGKNPWTDGSSGLYGVARLLFHHDCDRVVVAGIRIDSLPNAFRGEMWYEHQRYRRGWENPKRLPVLRAHVRSMSGWTRELLGAPTREWLTAKQAA